MGKGTWSLKNHYRGIFSPLSSCACERSFETVSFCLKFWLFSSRRPRTLILAIFSNSKRPFEKQTTTRLVTYLCLSMDKIWAKILFIKGSTSGLMMNSYLNDNLEDKQCYFSLASLATKRNLNLGWKLHFIF